MDGWMVSEADRVSQAGFGCDRLVLRARDDYSRNGLDRS